MNFDPKNILLINFGQIGDVILSLPAMRALRERFANSRLTLFVGTSAKAIVEMSGLADEIIAVDRVELRDSNPLWSIKEIVKLTFEVRRRGFDFVIDLHSLAETNLLGFFSGAKSKLFVNRGNRSLNFLSNFRPKPPAEIHELHVSEFYARSLEPLGVKRAGRPFRLIPDSADFESVRKLFDEEKLAHKKLIGINFGAGSRNRRTSLASYGRIAKLIHNNGEYGVVVFAGPEESGRREEFDECFPPGIPFLDNLSLKELAAAFSNMKAVIGNDSGPIHLAGAVGVPIVLISGLDGVFNFGPLANELRVVREPDLRDAGAENVFGALRSMIDGPQKNET